MDNSLGKYTEEIDLEATLEITKDEWQIHYVFLGPDLRYNPYYLDIDESYIDTYIHSLKNNFNKYQELKETLKLPQGKNYILEGEDEMIIELGSYRQGVRIHKRSNRYMCNQEQVNQFIKEYRYCKKRAKEVQKLLQSL